MLSDSCARDRASDTAPNLLTRRLGTGAGSRVHILRFAEESGGMVLKEDTFDQPKPGVQLKSL